jgi:hypothetical protein
MIPLPPPFNIAIQEKSVSTDIASIGAIYNKTSRGE